MDFVTQAKKMGVRSLLLQGLTFLSVLTSAFMIWKGMSLFTNSESPVVVVLSGSMEPAYYRGDILFPGQRTFGDRGWRGGGDIPIVHRVMKVHTERENGKQFLLTKGDNNPLWIQRDEIVGRVKGFVPYAGMGTIWMNDYPQLKMGLLGTLCLLSLFSNE
ncbi:hypothetical protein DL89DRAFT_277379 [Linderina pennispora]|uniref:Signal peptidase complex catalytic subunit SEC11 n=1 Tax=Linderina pennispora TaxID=61395 RepID=A0A1Y1WGT6_9FUNG|nr:signal peptidase complex catalytic subunit SEC11 [Linderina pennispora]ORX72771.1 hypothetical protein DL89DRAFT_277379 [Linderina pennispora]